MENLNSNIVESSDFNRAVGDRLTQNGLWMKDGEIPEKYSAMNVLKDTLKSHNATYDMNDVKIH
jgi:hypothetical protein